MRTKATFAITVLSLLTLTSLGLETAPPALAAVADTMVFKLDVSGSYAAGATISVTVELQNGGVADSTNAPGDTITLSGVPTLSSLTSLTNTVNSSGDAIWTDLSVTQAGTSYKITATDNGLSTSATQAQSAAFNVEAGPLKTLTISGPKTAIAGVAAGPYTATGTDTYGNPLGDLTAHTAFSITTDGTCTGGSDGGGNGQCTPITTAAGHQVSGTDSVDGVSPVTSNSISVAVSAGSATQLVWGTQPSNITAGQTIPAVTVRVEDKNGNLVTGSTASITMALATNAFGGTLLGSPKVVSASSGIATFSNLSVDRVGTGYTLSASSGSLTAATSASFDVTGPGPGSALGLNPLTDTVSVGELASYTADELDQFGNTVATNVATTYHISPAPGTCSGVSCSSGTAGSYTVTGTLNTNSLIKGTATLIVQTTKVNHLAFQQQPTTVPQDTPITPAVIAAVEDGGNAVVTSASGSITLSVVGGRATLLGTVTEPINNGVATFPSVHIHIPGRAYQLEAVSSGRTSGASVSFNIQGPASITVTVSARTVDYGRRVTVRAHLAHWSTTTPTVSFFYRPYPSIGLPIPIGGHVPVGSKGNARIRTPRLSRQVHVWAVYDAVGDNRYLSTGSSPQNVRVRVSITAHMTGFYAINRSGYRLYHYNKRCPSKSHVGCPTVLATVLPNLSGEKVGFRVEYRRSGRWRPLADFGNRLDTGGMATEVIFYGSRAIEFVPLRVRAEFSGDAIHSANVSTWRYFEVTR